MLNIFWGEPEQVHMMHAVAIMSQSVTLHLCISASGVYEPGGQLSEDVKASCTCKLRPYFNDTQSRFVGP